MAVRGNLPDLNEPFTEYEKALLEKLLSDPTQFPPKFKAWLTDYVGTNSTFHPDSMPSLAGEEWREVGATGQPAFETSWVNYAGGFETAAFYKDSLGIVHLKGLVANGTVNPSTGVIFTLPEGYRPALRQLFTSMDGASAIGRVDVTPAGSVLAMQGNNTFYALNGITFRAA